MIPESKKFTSSLDPKVNEEVNNHNEQAERDRKANEPPKSS